MPRRSSVRLVSRRAMVPSLSKLLSGSTPIMGSPPGQRHRGCTRDFAARDRAGTAARRHDRAWRCVRAVGARFGGARRRRVTQRRQPTRAAGRCRCRRESGRAVAGRAGATGRSRLTAARSSNLRIRATSARSGSLGVRSAHEARPVLDPPSNLVRGRWPERRHFVLDGRGRRHVPVARQCGYEPARRRCAGRSTYWRAETVWKCSGRSAPLQAHPSRGVLRSALAAARQRDDFCVARGRAETPRSGLQLVQLRARSRRALDAPPSTVIAGTVIVRSRARRIPNACAPD